MSLPNLQKTLKIVKDFRNMSWKSKLAYLFVSIILIVLGIMLEKAYVFNFVFSGSPTLGVNNFTNQTKISIGETSPEPQGRNKDGDNKNNTHTGFEPSLWTAKYYDSADDEGFLCPSVWSGFPSPTVWNNKEIPAVFNKIVMTYEVKNKDLNDTSLPTFIFTLGKNPTILRFYIPQKTKQDKPQFVGFQKIKLGSREDLFWELPQTLSAPIALVNTEIVLRIDSQQKKENINTYNFNVRYLSALTKTRQEDSFSYDVALPTPNLDGYQVFWGIGTFKNSCLKLKTYEVL